jgi:diguanylate cyclase (GGDEF)-like protein
MAALLPDLPLVACILVIQWIFSSALRRVISAMMLSLIVAYFGVMYLTVQDLWTIPWTESAAILIAITVGCIGRSRHERIVLGLFRRNAILERLVSVDELTGVCSRRHIIEIGRRELLRSRRTGLPLAVLLVDIDNFKHINDTFGHAAGDQALIDVSTAIQKGIRAQDMVGRYGGDEFLILLVDANLDGARETALRLHRRVTAWETPCGDAPINPSVSIGLAPLRAETVDFNCLVAEADQALYKAKVAGRNRVCWNSPDVGHAKASQA